MLSVPRPGRTARGGAGRARRSRDHRGRDRRLIGTLELDHVLIAVSDLAGGVLEFEDRYGLASVEGGRHPGWGTANRIVPLGDSYLELVAVVDRTEAETSTLGRWVLSRVEELPCPLGWAVRTDDLDDVAARLGLRPEPGSRARPDGSVLAWRSCGVETAVGEPGLPFFIEWARGVTLPGRGADARPATVGGVRLSGDRVRLEEWLGPHALPLEISPGPSQILAVTLAGPSGSIEIA